ncbi:hypothetical protein CMI47_23045 [Candidatus Pacearchaeota archaeon]|nr:hypothetical protein [Candidatus Pacearchaeota archaeon]
MKKVLAITDSYRWATYFRAKNLEKNLKNFNFSIISFHDIEGVNFNDFDIVYVLNWPIYSYVRNKIKKGRNYRLVTGVSSHVGRPNANKMKPFFKIFDKVGLSNKILFDEFKKAGIKNILYTPFGVDHNIFKKITNPNDYKFVFGWVGNKSRSVKRYAEIKKAFKELGPKYKLITVGQDSNYSREKMVNFYNSIGTIICYSSSEGTPNPVLEAAMCGRAVISTKVGNVPELMRSIKYFKPVSSKRSLRIAIKNHANKIDLNDAGSKVRNSALRSWTWKFRSRRFVELFR